MVLKDSLIPLLLLVLFEVRILKMFCAVQLRFFYQCCCKQRWTRRQENSQFSLVCVQYKVTAKHTDRHTVILIGDLTQLKSEQDNPK